MDDKKLFELKRLELAYYKQLIYVCGVISIAILGLILYIINIYNYNFQLLLVAIMLIAVGVICIFNFDSNLKEISGKIKRL
jgi:uncharacterized membrane protein HdeD (DUF308 family)